MNEVIDPSQATSASTALLPRPGRRVRGHPRGPLRQAAVDVSAVGALNNQPGYILTGQAKDGGPVGSGLDTVSITIHTPTGELVYSSSGPVSEGDVVITP